MNAELATAIYPLHLDLDLCQALGGWSQMMASVGREERIQDWDTCRKQAPVAACGQLLPLLGDVSHSLGVGTTGLFLEVGMRRISWQRRCS